MFYPSEEDIAVATAYAEANPDKEVCGLFLKDRTFLEVENVFVDPDGMDLPVRVETPTSGFAIPFEVYMEHGRNIACIMHSHPDSDHLGPSVADISAQKATNAPWMVVDLHRGWFVFDKLTCVTDLPYVPVVSDELSELEAMMGIRISRDQNWNEDPGALLRIVDEQVLLGRLRTVDRASGVFEEGDVVLGGPSPDGPPDTLAIFDEDGQFMYCLKKEEVTYSEKVPCQNIHRILRLSD